MSKGVTTKTVLRSKNGQWILEEMSSSLAIKEMQMKTTLGVHLTPVRMANIGKTNNSAGKDAGGPQYTAEGMWTSATAMDGMEVHHKTKNRPTS
jgi:hypothetical protein